MSEANQKKLQVSREKKKMSFWQESGLMYKILVISPVLVW